MEYLLLIVGFALLVIGANWLVGSASRLAGSFGISPLMIGLSVVAFGTSAPEAAIGIMSGISQANLITVGDVIGSSIANIALLIGVSAIIRPIVVDRTTLTRELPMSLVIQLLFCLFILTGFGVSRIESIILLILFVLYLIFLIYSVKKGNLIPQAVPETSEMTTGSASEDNKQLTVYRWKNFVLLLGGLGSTVFGADLVVSSSRQIASAFGMSETLIGLTIVALGTSLPELAISVVSAVRKEHELMAGNLIGSNIFNILLVIGLSATIHPITRNPGIWINLAFMLTATILFRILAARNRRISRPEGTILVVFYAAFIVISIILS